MANPLPFMGYHHGFAAGQEGISQLGLGMAIAASMVVLTMFQQFLLNHFQGYVKRLLRKLFKSLDPNVQIKFANDDNSGPKIHEAYGALETYLSSKCSDQAPRLKASFIRDIKTPVLGLDLGEGVEDQFNGVTVRWQLGEDEEPEPFRSSRKNRYYTLAFQKSDRKTVVGEYLRHVMEAGKALVTSNRQLKLYSNSSSKYGSNWKCMMNFNHPAKFETLAMEQERKEEIIDDLMRFSAGREYYMRIGKPWKRGYLLHGPPGTGKTTMIAAMANFLSYDVYYLELSAVCSNDTLKHLLNQIPCNSILVIEDIDCSGNITNKRERDSSQCEEKKEQILETVTLSGLLNCIDGLFSANDGGRIMVFTTNHVKAIDSALLRRGRMDKHIEMPFCGFEAFRVLAKNYLGIEEHELFGRIEGLLKETRVSPADVAENLIERSGKGEDCRDDYCLKKLIEVLEENIQLEKRGEGNGQEIESEPEKITSNGHL